MMWQYVFLYRVSKKCYLFLQMLYEQFNGLQFKNYMVFGGGWDIKMSFLGDFKMRCFPFPAGIT